MNVTLRAAIERLIERRGAGINYAREDRRAGRAWRSSAWLRQSPAERRGRRRERAGRVRRYADDL